MTAAERAALRAFTDVLRSNADTRSIEHSRAWNGLKALISDDDNLLPELLDAADERDRLAEALHAVRAHPDWIYCGPLARSEVEGLEADGWERNEPAERSGLAAYRTGSIQELRRRLETT